MWFIYAALLDQREKTKIALSVHLINRLHNIIVYEIIYPNIYLFTYIYNTYVHIMNQL